MNNLISQLIILILIHGVTCNQFEIHLPHALAGHMVGYLRTTRHRRALESHHLHSGVKQYMFHHFKHNGIIFHQFSV